MTTPLKLRVIGAFVCVILVCCGHEDDFSKSSVKQKDENYQRGYDWAKTNAITDDEECVRFMHLATKSPELEGCIDYFREYKKKAREFSGEDNESDEIAAAPSAPIEEGQIEDDCENMNQFCTN